MNYRTANVGTSSGYFRERAGDRTSMTTGVYPLVSEKSIQRIIAPYDTL